MRKMNTNEEAPHHWYWRLPISFRFGRNQISHNEVCHLRERLQSMSEVRAPIVRAQMIEWPWDHHDVRFGYVNNPSLLQSHEWTCVNLDFVDAHSRFGLEGSSIVFVEQNLHLTKWGRLFAFPFSKSRVNCYQVNYYRNEGFFLIHGKNRTTSSDFEPFSRTRSGSHSSRKG